MARFRSAAFLLARRKNGERTDRYVTTGTTHAEDIAQWCEARVVLDGPVNIHLTGCHHSCAQHYIGDIGLLACKVEEGEEQIEGYHVYVGGGFGPHAALSAFENAGTRDFDIGALSQLDDDEFNALDPVQWPAREGMAGTTTRFFGDGQFFTADRKARFIACAKPALSADVSQHFPLRLNTGRVRDQWHTMTRSGQSPRLANHSPEPFVEIHPADAANAGLTDGAFARVSSSYGT